MPSAFYLIYIALTTVSLITCFGLTVYAWRHRQQPGTRYFFWWMVSALIWVGAALMAIMADTPAMVHFWDNQFKLTAVSLLPVLYLLFVLDYTGRQKWLRSPVIILLFAIPLLTNWFSWTPFPPNLFEELTYELRAGYIYVDEEATIWFWVHTYYSYGLVLLSTVLLLVQAVRSRQPYRGQAFILALGIIPPLVANYVTITQPFGIPAYEWTAISFPITGLLWSWALYRYRLLDVMPVARDYLVESMDDALLVLDTRNRVLDLNPAARHLLNLTETAVIGQDILHLIPPAEQHLYDQFADVHEGQAEIEIGSGRTTRHFDLRINPLRQKGTTIGRLIVLREVTDQVRLLQELDAYAHTVAHDLKNPLAGIIGYLDMAQEEIDEPEIDRAELQALVSRAHLTSGQLQKVIESLLLLASVRRRTDVEPTTIHLGEVVETCVARLGHQIESSGAEVVLAVNWPTVVGYRPWVEEALMNYISNALKYGGQPPRVNITAVYDDTEADMVRLTVADNGHGLTSDEQAKLFIPFSRLNPSQSDGHGLGLSIVQRIVTRLGGRVGVDSTPGHGSKFWFTLPTTATAALVSPTAVSAQM